MEEISQKSSVEITRNAKGDTQFTVKSRADTVVEAEAVAVEAYDRLCSRYS